MASSSPQRRDQKMVKRKMRPRSQGTTRSRGTRAGALGGRSHPSHGRRSRDRETFKVMWPKMGSGVTHRAA